MVKERIDNFSETEKAKIYCIVKGQNPDGSEWGRIDFVGVNYVMKNKDKITNGVGDRNNLPLVIKYYSYQDKTYSYIKDSNQLESNFDKQLMDVFLQSDCTSYELYKSFGRDYEYHPSLAQVIGKGKWYINWSKPNERVAKIIEVPDWDDFHFQDLFDQYLDDCGNEMLTNEGARRLKEKMAISIEKQKERLEELKQFHIEQNDHDKDSAILIDIWEKRIGAFEELVKELKMDCVIIEKVTSPCEDFEPLYEEHKELCDKERLTKKIGDSLKEQMQDCIDNSYERLEKIKTTIEKYKRIPDWEEDITIKEEVKKLELELIERKKTLEEEEKKLESLPERCIPDPTGPVPSMPPIIFFEDGFKKQSGYNKAATAVAQWLIDNPLYDIKIISDAQGKNINPNAEWDKKIPKTTKKLTYRQRLSNLLTAYKDDIIAAGKGKITKNRIHTFYGALKDKKISTIPIPK